MVFQTPTPAIPIPSSGFERRIHSGERSHYAVVSDWESQNGRAHYEYAMDFQVEKTKEKRVEYTVVVRITGLTAVYDGVETHTASAGVIPIKLSAGGPPRGIAAGGAITTFALPLLALTLPPSAPDPTGGFKVSEFAIERVGAFSGAGLVAADPVGQAVTLHLTEGAGATAPTLDIRSVFRIGGRLVHAVGTYADAAGTLKFIVNGR